MNDILKNALASRKKMVDETSSTSAIGQGFGSIDDKPTTAKLPFYTGDMVDKSQTGFTGLLNQGATCYLNSLIQSLFMTPELRSAVFEWRYDATRDAEEKRCIPLQLQKLFGSLQISVKGAVHTTSLTTSFGWSGREVYQQHDVMELFNVLFENLEIQSIGSRLATVVSDLHRGEYKDYVQCLKCNDMRGRTVPFVGLSLELTSADSFDEAMKQYITPEIMDGTNKVTCNKCDDKQDSKKGIRLTNLPYFLGIHLKRWAFDLRTLMRHKINKKISFPRTFNGAQYLNCDGNDETQKDKDNNDDDKVMEYELYSMMIHTGGATGGHYFAYIKHFKSGKWLQFNDSNVKEIPEEDIEEWFNPKIVEKEGKQDTKEKENENKENVSKDTKITPAPIPDSDGLDIGAAISRNLKEKQQKDVTQKLKEDKKKRPRFLHPFGAAYMLMYRLIDTQRNVITVSDDLIAANIASEIKESDMIYSKQKAEYDRLRQYITLKIHYDNKCTDIMVKKNESMKTAVQTVYNEMKLDENGIANADCIRLRNMKVLNAVPLEPYDDRLQDLIESFEFHDPKHLILETRSIDKEFEKYSKAKISLRMIELDEVEMQWKKEVLIQIEDNAKIGSLRATIANKIGIDDVLRVRIAYLNEGLALLLSDDEKRIKADERILDGSYVHVEVCDKGQKHNEGNSKLMQKFDTELNKLHLLYNDLDFDRNKENIFTNSLEIDVRTQVAKLREILADKLGVSVDELVLRKGFHQQELKNNLKTLEQYKLHTNAQVFVEMGKPLKPTEFLFQIFIEDEIYKRKKKEIERVKWNEYLEKEKAKEDNENKDNDNTEHKTVKSGIKDSNLGPAFLFVGDCVLNESWALDKVKLEIRKNVANVPDANRMRLRSFNDHNRMIRVYFDCNTLKETLKRSIKDYTQICCQETAKENEVFTEDMMLMYIARWYPERMDFGEQIEFAFNKKTKIKSELREELSKFSGIPFEYIRCSHPRAYLLKNVENRRKVCILDWENTKCGQNTTLISKAWKCKNGEFILYKDNREKERLTKEDFDTKSIASIIPQREQALIFYSPQQQIERERQQKIEEQQMKKEMEKAKQDAIERMTQSSDLAAKKAAQKAMK